MLRVISALHHVPLCMDRIWLLQAAVETNVDLQLPQTRCVVNSDSTRIVQFKTSVCHINFDGSSADVTLFNSLKILLVWEVCGWLRVICILSKACSFASWKILTQTWYFMFYQNKINCTTLKQTTKKLEVGAVEAKNLMQTR